jgi:hypothetical protein
MRFLGGGGEEEEVGTVDIILGMMLEGLLAPSRR